MLFVNFFSVGVFLRVSADRMTPRQPGCNLLIGYGVLDEPRKQMDATSNFIARSSQGRSKNNGGRLLMKEDNDHHRHLRTHHKATVKLANALGRTSHQFENAPSQNHRNNNNTIVVGGGWRSCKEKKKRIGICRRIQEFNRATVTAAKIFCGSIPTPLIFLYPQSLTTNGRFPHWTLPWQTQT